jgi:hypothetical protein
MPFEKEMSGLCATQKEKIRKNRPFVYAQNNKTDGIIPFVETQMPFLKNILRMRYSQMPFIEIKP